MKRPRPPVSPLEVAVVIAMALAASPFARAQTPPPAPPPPPPEPTASPGARIVTGQAPVVGGNAAGARERAMDEAVRHAVELALADIADAPTRAAEAKTVKALLARAKSFVPRYRTLEEGESGGIYTVRLEAEVDELALRAKLERPSAAATPPASRPGALSVVLVPGDRQAGTTALATGLAGALSSAGIRARLGDETAVAPGQGVTAVARVTAEVTDEGPLRGTGRVSVACRGTVRLPAGPSRPAAEQSASARVFVTSPGAAEHTETGRADCFGRLVVELAGRVTAGLGSGGAGAGGDLRSVIVDADVIEPAAVPALLKSVRSVGAVSAAELTRVVAGRAEIRLRARAATPALAAALPRGAGSMITLTDVEVAGDVIHLRARLRPTSTPPAGTNP